MDRVILRDWTHLKALGIDGATCQSRPTCHEVYALNMMAFARSAWQDEVDPDALLDEYLAGMYGSAAGDIRPIFDAFHEAWRAAESNANAAGVSARVISPNQKNIVLQMDALGDARLDACLERARARASNDRERRQVNALARASRYWKAFAHYLRAVQAADDALGAHFAYRAEASALKAEAELKRAEMEQASRQVPPGWIQDFQGRDTPPKILSQPRPVSADMGAGSAVLQVGMGRQPGVAPIHWQWQKREGDRFADIPWANFERYGVSPVTANAQGEYRCVISNALGVVTSATAVLTVTADIR